MGNTMGRGRLKLSSSGCVHFMYADYFSSGEAQAAVGDLRSAGIRCVYTSYRHIEYGDLHIANTIARELNLQHAPYPPRTSHVKIEVWVPFLDDLITLSESEKTGVVLFVDGGDVFLAANSRGMFRLIEAFLIQVHHWMEKKKPCHLCFLMEPNDSLRAQFAMS